MRNNHVSGSLVKLGAEERDNYCSSAPSFTIAKTVLFLVSRSRGMI
jgi:hypothetical protein